MKLPDEDNQEFTPLPEKPATIAPEPQAIS